MPLERWRRRRLSHAGSSRLYPPSIYLCGISKVNDGGDDEYETRWINNASQPAWFAFQANLCHQQIKTILSLQP
ncbi:unnamed protein product [Nippostrongylus brasiliensis]|uniref:Uncharacterized protein n=1 Tax=Nippostrongylus brasiliensis TaxID=27835 RepID=A0A0N4XSU4_NIPBR|nr:unnamed protein product [Nippostrongylus brasiliensis]